MAAFFVQQQLSPPETVPETVRQFRQLWTVVDT